MKYIAGIPLPVRVILCFALMAFAFLFLGAVRIQDSMRNRSLEQQNAREASCRIVQGWDEALPRQEKKAWETLAARDPVFCLRTLCTPSQGSR